MSTLRVMVHDAWDEITVPWNADLTLANLKREVLRQARVTAPPEEFVLKFRGATLPDESLTVNEAALPEHAALIVLRRRRRAVI